MNNKSNLGWKKNILRNLQLEMWDFHTQTCSNFLNINIHISAAGGSFGEKINHKWHKSAIISLPNYLYLYI